MLPLLAPALMAASLRAVEPRAFIPPTSAPTAADETLADYFRAETALLSTRCLTGITSLADWQAQRETQRQELQAMLGLQPMPERGDLKAVVTGKLEHEEFTVEKLHFQASPRLYVTANLYLPKKLTSPAPAILYLCGHSKAITNGISLGNKTGYQHHGAWFARNGYVCLVMDTLQLGEIEGVHHGTHHLGQWWWNSRGYTAAGAEAWCGIRALDYLCSRPEVDRERIGMTGRSGGGSYTWTVAALDDRVKVAAPIAGITDLQNQIVDNCVDGHCDCMFFLNTFRWDFPQVAALIAPRPLLIGNSDKDRIFPLDGVLRLHEQARRIYALHGATNQLGLLITDGPHEDTQDLQVPVFRWFNRFLKGEEPLIEMAAKDFFEPQQLRVFDTLPADAVNTNLQALFVPQAAPLSSAALKEQRESILATLRTNTFGGWPADDTPLEATQAFSVERDGLKFSAWDFTSQHDVRLRLYFLEAGTDKPVESVALHALDPATWPDWLGAVRSAFDAELKDELLGTTNSPALNPGALEKMKNALAQQRIALAFVAPRGVGLTAWSGGEKRLTQIRRRFMLLGQTLDGMRVWDLRRAVQMVHFVREGDAAKVTLRASGDMALNVVTAALFEPGVRRLELERLPKSLAEGPDYLNVLRTLDLPQLLELVRATAEVKQF